MEKLQRQSKFIRIVGQIAFWLAIVAGITAIFALWLAPSSDLDINIDNVKFKIDQLLPWHRLLLTGIVIMVIGVVGYGVRHFYRLFKLYEQGEIFGEDNVRHFAAIGKAMMMWFLVRVLINLSMFAHAEYAEMKLNFNLSISSLIIGIAIILISKVMDEGRKIREEQELTI